MKAVISKSKVEGSVTPPSSKSLGHRAIICASLAKGKSIISNVDYSQDIEATVNAMKKLGAQIVKKDKVLEIHGISGFNAFDELIIDCNESGSTLRFLVPIFSLVNRRVKFIGKESLFKRPLSIYEDIFKGCRRTSNSFEISDTLKSSKYKINGNISSQFISGLLFTLPLLENDSQIEVISPFESKSYVDLTLECLKAFGIDIEEKVINNNTVYFIKGNQKYVSTEYEVETDYSQAAFFCVLGAINNAVACLGLNDESKQGDREIINILKGCRANVDNIYNGYIIKPQMISDCTVSIKDCPDLGPILMVLGMYCDGTFTIKDASRLRIKESDRIESMKANLLKMGVDIETTQDTVIIKGKKQYPGNVVVESFNDHRIVMSMAIAATCMSNSVTINNADAIKKSYPNFFNDLKKLNCVVEIYE